MVALGASAEDKALSDEKREEVRSAHAKLAATLAEELRPPTRVLEERLRGASSKDPRPADGPGSRSIDDIWQEVVRTTNAQEAERRAKEEAEQDEAGLRGAVAEKERLRAEEAAARETQRRVDLGLQPLELN